MLTDHRDRNTHERFKELCALAVSGSLVPLELGELQAHLQDCGSCREILAQYQTLTTEGMVTLADSYVERRDHASWDDTRTRRQLLARIQADQRSASDRKVSPFARVQTQLGRMTANPFAKIALAAGLILAVGLGAYHLGTQAQIRKGADLRSPSSASVDSQSRLSEEKSAADELLAAQAKKLAQLEQESYEKEQELAKLRAALRALETHSKELVVANNQSDERLQTISQQRDTLNAQLQSATQAYEKDRSELASLRAERDKAPLQTASLEAKINELTTTNRDQERRLKETEQFLSSDRDIRELMGARKLYIADVFDVDGSSRTQKPFGRVFYTQGKSLIFYAFDLDREPGVVNASTFQVWGQREAPQGERALPRNLGILYMDSESNRRWVMRFDDPKELAEIDAVFVTVEPHGGSHKPTSKPFLYALLRNEANHP